MPNQQLIPEPDLANLQLSVEILAQLNQSIDARLPSSPGNLSPGNLSPSDSDINADIDEFAKSATQNGNLQKLDLLVGTQRIQLLVTVHPADGSTLSSQPQLDSQPPIRLAAEITPADIYSDLEQALKDYHSLPRLGQNPLVPLLQTDLTNFTREEPINPGGLALRHLLDTLIVSVCGVETGAMISRGEWSAEHYLHLRYRQRIAHKDLADPLGFSERHLQRHRQQQIQRAAALLCADGDGR